MSDPYFDDVLYLQHYEVDITSDVVGADWSPSVSGGTVAHSTVKARYGTGSLYTTGTSPSVGQINQNPATLILSQPFTLEASVNVDSLVENGVFMQGGSTNNDRFELRITAAGELSVFASDGGTTRLNGLSSGASITGGDWFDLAVTYDGTDVYTYVNGTPYGPFTGFANYAPLNDIFRWGWARQGGSARSLNGYLDEMRITQVDRYGGLSYTPAAFPDEGVTVPPAVSPKLYLNTPSGTVDILDPYAAKGYAGIYKTGVPTAITIDSGWQVLIADTDSVAVPVNAQQSTAFNALSFSKSGVWSVSVNLTVSHDSAQGGRTFGIQIYNANTDEQGRTGVVGVGRNVEYTNYGATFIVEISESNLDQLYQVRVGGTTDTFVGAEEVSYSFSVQHISGN